MAGFQYWCVLIRAKFEGIVTMPGLKRKKNAVVWNSTKAEQRLYDTAL